ncbi:UNKNOWN [Stylonychia lemnae]|uniref:PROP1-like PPR domain-containing protein n=1 Tax=Stylonychia lemnae TaxID=5949 RepID=A0A078A1L2_STYLE|nr:UNKNOWN [Stylonychia lemnae]|eukprot:CDW75338.1 UNKNOWN [Stylonychia lemnae]
MNSQITISNDNSCHSTSNAVPRQNLSTIEGYVKVALFQLKLDFFTKIAFNNTRTIEASPNESNADNLNQTVSTITNTDFNSKVMDTAIIVISQRAISQQRNTMETNILSYEEDLEKVKMLYAFLKLAQQTQLEDESTSSIANQFKRLQKYMKVNDISLEAYSKYMEALLLYRKNGNFYEIQQDIMSKLKISSVSKESDLKQVEEFFKVSAKGVMFTKSAQKGLVIVQKMLELRVPISAESHLNPIIESCFRGNKGYLIQDILQLIGENYQIQISTLKLLIKYLSKQNQFQLVMNHFDTYTNHPDYNKDINQSLVLNQVLDCLIRNDQLNEAESIFQRNLAKTQELSGNLISENFVDLMTFSTIIKGYCKYQRLPNALQTLTLMKERGIKADEVLYNSLLDGCSKSSQLTSAFNIYHEMISEGVVPSTITYNSLIDCCVRSNSQARAWQVLEEMKLKGVKADNYTYSTLFKGIKGTDQTSDLDKAFQLYQQLLLSQEFQPDEILFNVLLDACINCKQLDRAVQLFKQIKQSNNELLNGNEGADENNQEQSKFYVRPDEISFNTIIKGCSQERKLSMAFEMFNLMKRCDLKPNDVTYNSMIDACVRCNSMKSAWALLTEMKTFNIIPDNFTYSTLIKGIRAENQSQSGISNQQDLEKAFGLLEQMKHSNHVKPDEILYNCLIDACVRFHDVNRAVAVFHEMQLSNIKPSSVTYGILIKAYGQANQLENAFFVFRKMKESNLIPNSVTYGCLIDACVKNNQIDQAMEVFETMKKDGVQLNTIIFTTLIKGFAKAYKLEQALEVYEVMKLDDKIKPNNVTFNSMIDCCIRCNAIQRASEIFDEMKKSPQIRPDLITYSTMIKGYCKEKNIHQALVILNEMENQQIQADEVLYNSLLDGCCKANEIEMALKVYKNMEILRIKPSNVTYSILVKIYGKQRNLTKALGVLEEMKKDGIKPGLIVYTCLLQTCIKSRQLKTAEQIFKDMRQQGIRGDSLTYSTMINGCLQSQKFETILELLKDAFDSHVQLASEVGPNIMNELSKWNPGNPQTKTELTQQIMGYLDSKENMYYGGNRFQGGYQQRPPHNQSNYHGNHHHSNNYNNNGYNNNQAPCQNYVPAQPTQYDAEANQSKTFHKKSYFNSSRNQDFNVSGAGAQNSFTNSNTNDNSFFKGKNSQSGNWQNNTVSDLSNSKRVENSAQELQMNTSNIQDTSQRSHRQVYNNNQNSTQSNNNSYYENSKKKQYGNHNSNYNQQKTNKYQGYQNNDSYQNYDYQNQYYGNTNKYYQSYNSSNQNYKTQGYQNQNQSGYSNNSTYQSNKNAYENTRNSNSFVKNEEQKFSNQESKKQVSFSIDDGTKNEIQDHVEPKTQNAEQPKGGFKSGKGAKKGGKNFSKQQVDKENNNPNFNTNNAQRGYNKQAQANY